MSMAPPVCTSPSVTIIAEPNISISANSVQCGTPPSPIHSNIKQEKNVNFEKIEKLSPRQQSQNSPIAFSITNILSNNFGRTKLSTLSPSQQQQLHHQQYAQHQNQLEQQQLFFTNILSNNFSHTDLSSLTQHQHTHHNHLQHQQLLSHYQAAVAAAQSLHHSGSHSFIDSWAFGNKLWSPARSDPSPIKKSVRRPSSQPDSNTSSSLPNESNSTSLASASTPNDASSSSTTTTTTKDHQSNSMDSGMESSEDTKSETGSTKDENGSQPWPAWIYCTRYSDRPSSGPRYRKPKAPKAKGDNDEKRPRTAFSMDQLARLKREFNENRYLNERRRQQLSTELGLNEAQIKIWFQNKRAKIKKSSGQKNPLAMQLMAQGLYNHSTVPLTKEEEELEMRMNGKL